MNPRPSNDPAAGHLPGVQRLSESALTWRLDAIAKALGVSRRTLERERSAGRFPPPDLSIGKMPLWRPETIRRWVERGGVQ
jgi:predicted DNA-binding transcriptional regulator AlpA